MLAVSCVSSSYNGAVGGNFLCAGFKEGGTDKCSYDSGGPLACPDPSGDGTWMLAGIVSWGERCALPYKYGVYTNVNEYTRWMEENLKIDRWISTSFFFFAKQHRAGLMYATWNGLIVKQTLKMKIGLLA